MDNLKQAIYYIIIGFSILGYVHATFPEKNRVERIEERLFNLATKEDIKELREDIKAIRK